MFAAQDVSSLSSLAGLWLADISLVPGLTSWAWGYVVPIGTGYFCNFGVGYHEIMLSKLIIPALLFISLLTDMQSMHYQYIDNNYWENGSGTPVTPLASNGQNAPAPFKGIDYTGSAPSGGLNIFSDWLECSSGIFLGNKGKKETETSLQEDTNCEQLYANARTLSDGSKWEDAHQAYRKYIESCATITNVAPSFTSISGTNGFRSNDPNRHIECREWLKKVLYLNLDTIYYCSDVMAIWTTMQFFDSTRGYDINGALTIAKYLLDNNRCPMFTEYFTNGWKSNRDYQLQHWRDTVKDSTKTPLDTTLPTLEDLDLEILRGQSGVVNLHFASSSPIMYYLAEPNPFKDKVTLHIELASPLVFHIEIFDVLGKSVYSGNSSYYEEGEHQIMIDGKTLPHGMLYARLTPMNGPPKTIKLRHY